jgi:hypothetical protein
MKERERLKTCKSNLMNGLKKRIITLQDYQDMKGGVEWDVVILRDKPTDLQ